MNWAINRTERVKNLKRKRNIMEGKLRRCEIIATRCLYLHDIENINILLQDMCVQAYQDSNVHRKAKF